MYLQLGLPPGDSDSSMILRAILQASKGVGRPQGWSCPTFPLPPSDRPLPSLGSLEKSLLRATGPCAVRPGCREGWTEGAGCALCPDHSGTLTGIWTSLQEGQDQTGEETNREETNPAPSLGHCPFS